MDGACGRSVDANAGKDPFLIVGHDTRNRGNPQWPLGEKGYTRAKPGDGTPVSSKPDIPIKWQVNYTALPVVEEIVDLRNW